MFTELARSITPPLSTLSGFSQYKTLTADLPAGERDKLDALADRILAGYRPARVPIVGVLAVGHADQDVSRGVAFEQAISLERARQVLRDLQQALRRRAASTQVLSLALQVAMRPVASGARQRLFTQPNGETQRAANRRVELFLAEAVAPWPSLDIDAIPRQKAIGRGAPVVRSALVSFSFVPLFQLDVTPPLAGSPTFVEGPPRRPAIRHDHGFLDDGKGNLDPSKRQAPTPEDFERAKFMSVLLVVKEKGPDFKDAARAYRHFLVDHNGTDFTFDYEAFLKDDRSGPIVLASAIEDARAGLLNLFDKKFPTPATSTRRDQLSATSTAVTVGNLDPLDLRYPYPNTDNWQKAIGGHKLWLSADLVVDSDIQSGRRSVTMTLTLHADDQYNFNPGAGDGAGIPDAVNGRFEITGIAREFLQTGTATRKVTFTVPLKKQADNRALPADQKVAP